MRELAHDLGIWALAVGKYFVPMILGIFGLLWLLERIGAVRVK